MLLLQIMELLHERVRTEFSIGAVAVGAIRPLVDRINSAVAVLVSLAIWY